jgi:hypothetical protein
METRHIANVERIMDLLGRVEAMDVPEPRRRRGTEEDAA